ncbi:unnamed protein product [Chondrus crispus]|uniref:Uncharacterized protein n=1 Tax=Chondrus crispus TaxID=2769 RepID=R7QF19_CHOCR|nr:unnamed protein product [Chondrus crispus]CDF35990.1 unnamed protein product [Chondrus crispus]|eukprot:XP_005715809.1 unnamed protein product [Chondrus crispus]
MHNPYTCHTVGPLCLGIFREQCRNICTSVLPSIQPPTNSSRPASNS